MNTKKSTKKLTKKTKWTAIQFRFLDDNHHALITKAAKSLGLSLNGWLIQTTLNQARKELGIK